MKLHLRITGVGDIGESWGIDDKVFKEGATCLAPSAADGITARIGNGLRIAIDAQNPMLKLWREEASKMADRYERFDKRSYDDTRKLIDAAEVESCHLQVFAVGAFLIILRLTVDVENQEFRRILDDFYPCWQFALYHSPMTKALLARAADLLTQTTDPELTRSFRTLTRRGPVCARVPDAEGTLKEGQIPFTDLTILCEQDDLPKLKPAVDAYNGKPTTQLDFFYHGTLYHGWSVSLYVPNEGPGKLASNPHNRDSDRVLFDIELANATYLFSQAIDRLFTDRLVEIVHRPLLIGTPGVDTATVSRLWLFGKAVPELIDLEASTITGEDRAYFTKFAEAASLTSLQTRIVHCTELLSSAIRYADEQRSLEQKRAEEERARTQRKMEADRANRDSRLLRVSFRHNLLLGIISCLTLSSIVGDILGGH